MSGSRSIIRTLMTGTQLMGWGLVALGLCAALVPLATGTALAFMVGFILLGAGALIGLFGQRVRAAGDGNLGLVIGALTALCGLALLLQPSAGLSLVRLVLVGYFLASGVSEISLAWRLRPEEDWRWMLLGGVVSVLSAAVLWTDWPISGARAVGVMLGAKLISIGWAIVRAHRRLEAVGARVGALRARLR